MNNYFCITKSNKIWLYGYTEIARQMYKIFLQHSYKVAGYLDKNMQLLTCNNIHLPDRVYNEDEIVIITLQSLNSQVEVAEYLYEKGCTNIVFAAAGTKYDLETAKKLRKAYETLYNGIIPNESVKIPVYKALLKDASVQSCLIHDFGKRVVTWCPIELLYTPSENMINKEMYSKYKELGSQKSWEHDAPLMAVLNDPNDISAIISFAIKHKGSPQQYINRTTIMTGKDMWKHELQSLELWEWEFSNGMDYFIDAAASCVWNEKGYFNIVDGCHRLTYLLLKEQTIVPINIEKKDYQTYINWESEASIGKKGKYSPAPSYFDTWWKNRDVPKICSRIMQILYDKRISVNRVLDAWEQGGYYSAQINKWKKGERFILHLYECVQQNVKDDKWEYYINEENWKGKYDVVFLGGNEQTLKYIISCIRWKVLFWESEEDNNMQSIISEKEYIEKEVVYQYYNGEKAMNIYALIK